MSNRTAEDLLHDAVSALYAAGAITSPEAAGGSDTPSDDVSWTTLLTADGDLFKVRAVLYAEGEMGPDLPPCWELVASFESDRPSFCVTDADGESIDDFVDAVQNAPRAA